MERPPEATGAHRTAEPDADLVAPQVAEAPGSGHLRRALALSTSASLLVPVVGVVTAPVLARGLGVDGRGEAALAMGPQALFIAVATLGLPEALTYHLARRPGATRRALSPAVLTTTALGVLCWLGTWFFASTLANGDSSLASLVVVGTALSIPLMVINLLRGAAAGHQMWGAIALERFTASVLRLVVLVLLLVTGTMDVRSAVIAMSVVPIVAGLAYWPLLRVKSVSDPASAGIARAVHSYGARVWLGSVAGMVSGRVGQLLMVPLSSPRQAGLYVVAITVSDTLYIVATAVRDALFGVNSRFDDKAQLLRISRVTLLISVLGAVVLGGSLPLWLGPVFGSDFSAALVPTWWLLAAAVANIPGLMAGAGLGAWGRPGLRSASIVVALVSNLTSFVLLVPSYGATGAAVAGVISGVAVSAFSVVAAARVGPCSPWAFLVPRPSDVTVLVREVGRVGGALLRKVRNR